MLAPRIDKISTFMAVAFSFATVLLFVVHVDSTSMIIVTMMIIVTIQIHLKARPSTYE